MVTTLSIHTDLNKYRDSSKQLSCFAGELSTLIGMEYLRATVVLNGSLQSLNAEIGIPSCWISASSALYGDF